jgi:hypothetical protein
MIRIALRSRVFAIEAEVHEDSGGLAEATGRIVIGDFEETFQIPLDFWSLPEYQRSWRKAYFAIKDDQHSRSCLVVAMTNPERSNFVTCWPLYREGEEVHVQNSLIFLDELESAFEVEEPWASLGPRRTVNEDGVEISEWTVSMNELRSFFG